MVVEFRNGIDLWEKCPNVDAAKSASKKFWGYREILAPDFAEPRTKRELIADGDSLDGCHLYPSGDPKYKHLACLPANIWPMARTDHRLWDTHDIITKMSILITNAYHEDRLLVRAIIYHLERLV